MGDFLPDESSLLSCGGVGEMTRNIYSSRAQRRRLSDGRLAVVSALRRWLTNTAEGCM